MLNKKKPDHLTQEQWDYLNKIEEEADKRIAQQYNWDHMLSLNEETGCLEGRIMDEKGHISTIRTDSLYGANLGYKWIDLREDIVKDEN
jgi:hypothetical protein